MEITNDGRKIFPDAEFSLLRGQIITVGARLKEILKEEFSDPYTEIAGYRELNQVIVNLEQAQMWMERLEW